MSIIKDTVDGVSSSVLSYVAIGIAVVIGGLSLWLYLVYGQLEKAELKINEQKALVALKDAQIDGFVGAISRQNEAIDKLTVNTKEGVEIMKTATGKIEVRYGTVQVPIKDAGCEVKLKAYEDLLKVFADRSNK